MVSKGTDISEQCVVRFDFSFDNVPDLPGNTGFRVQVATDPLFGDLVYEKTVQEAICPSVDCGNGVLDEIEQCDDGNTASGDCCSDLCVMEPCECSDPPDCKPICGDGFANREVCDDGDALTNNCTYGLTSCTVCNSQCIYGPGNPIVCGDGILQAGNEACDDGNGSIGDGCRPNCTQELCGDGIVDPNENCDDGNATTNDGCDASCNVEIGWTCDNTGTTSVCDPICADGLQKPGEECDRGNDNTCQCPWNQDETACDVCCNCALQTSPTRYCGDGIHQAGDEECDTGSSNSDTTPNACRTDCDNPSCGDGVVDNGEECDDGNIISGDGCSGTRSSAAYPPPGAAKKRVTTAAPGPASPLAGMGKSRLE